jgi:hypothetical protein
MFEIAIVMEAQLFGASRASWRSNGLHITAARRQSTIDRPEARREAGGITPEASPAAGRSGSQPQRRERTAALLTRALHGNRFGWQLIDERLRSPSKPIDAERVSYSEEHRVGSEFSCLCFLAVVKEEECKQASDSIECILQTGLREVLVPLVLDLVVSGPPDGILVPVSSDIRI